MEQGGEAKGRQGDMQGPGSGEAGCHHQAASQAAQGRCAYHQGHVGAGNKIDGHQGRHEDGEVGHMEHGRSRPGYAEGKHHLPARPRAYCFFLSVNG
jgi:hypothetical protein